MATTEGFSPRSRLIFAAPLQLGMLAEHDLADLYLTERLPAEELSDRLAAGMPRGYRVVDLYDVWVGAPAIAPLLAAADYRMTLLNAGEAELRGAAERLMAAERLPRERRKENRSIPYDLRPLLLDLRMGPADPAAMPPDAAGTAAAAVWMRLRHSQNLGSGRVDEVVAALAGELGLAANLASGENHVESPDASGVTAAQPTAAGPALEVIRPVRERLWLADERPV